MKLADKFGARNGTRGKIEGPLTGFAEQIRALGDLAEKLGALNGIRGKIRGP